MSNKLFCSLVPRRLLNNRRALIFVLMLACSMACVPLARASSDAPSWMHALVNAPLPAHDEKTNAVLLYSETTVNVISTDKMRTQVREAYKILRPDGRDFGTIGIAFRPQRKITSLRGWCIPAQGKDFEVKDKEAAEVSLPKIEGSDLITDVKEKLLRIPAADPGNIVGYEYEIEEHPLALQDVWYFQEHSPSREKHYSLQLPPGWEYKVTWINSPEVKPTSAGGNQWNWVVNNVAGVRDEVDMPPFNGVAGHMIISFFPPGGHSPSSFANWQEMGDWYRNLTSGRRDASPDIRQKVAALTASASSTLDKMQILAEFTQSDVRYVAIELGIGGHQPHTAAEVFTHRYGDCKDKATLMSSMLHEIGVDSYYVVINATRGSVTPEMPAYVDAFNHMILAIKLPDEVSSPALIATMQHPLLGRLLFFDPTSELTPLGQIGGYLQSNWGLLVTPEGGELVQLPKLAAETNGVQRTGHFVLDSTGTLEGEIREVRVGDRARSQRATQRAVHSASDKIKPIERILADSLSTFHIKQASIVNLQHCDQPFEYRYSFVAPDYAKNAGGFLVVRLRTLGSKTRGLLETKETRKFPVEFDGPVKDSDKFEISFPAGYVVEDLPPPVDADFSFASYHSKSEVQGNLIRYTRTFEVKELSVPSSRAEELKKLYRIIAGDERNTAVLKAAASH